jgi:hypothetical protein
MLFDFAGKKFQFVVKRLISRTKRKNPSIVKQAVCDRDSSHTVGDRLLNEAIIFLIFCPLPFHFPRNNFRRAPMMLARVRVGRGRFVIMQNLETVEKLPQFAFAQ